jgi:hypothetical protein
VGAPQVGSQALSFAKDDAATGCGAGGRREGELTVRRGWGGGKGYRGRVSLVGCCWAMLIGQIRHFGKYLVNSVIYRNTSVNSVLRMQEPNRNLISSVRFSVFFGFSVQFRISVFFAPRVYACAWWPPVEWCMHDVIEKTVSSIGGKKIGYNPDAMQVG